MAERVLTQRDLNRALLARQLLLERARTPIPKALERIGGIQAQYAPSMYVGLWSRLEGFERAALTRALERRSVAARSVVVSISGARVSWYSVSQWRPKSGTRTMSTYVPTPRASSRPRCSSTSLRRRGPSARNRRSFLAAAFIVLGFAPGWVRSHQAVREARTATVSGQ